MKNLDFDAEQMQIARRLADCATLYHTAFISNARFKEQFTDNYVALDCFLENYAYERQGAAAAYPKIAKLTIAKIFGDRFGSVTGNHARKAWTMYQEIAGKHFDHLDINKTHNPMNYDRGILRIMASQGVANIANHVKILLEDKETWKAHAFVDSIRGVGTKIASFYLRDIAYLSGIDEEKIEDQFYLQPMDTWLDQTLRIIMKTRVPQKLEDKQKVFVNLCHQAGCSPIALNQGAWVLGSQIAENFDTFKRIASGENMKQFLENCVAEERIYLRAIEEIVDKLVGT